MSTAILVLGGARSGKSHFAQHWAEGRPAPRRYLATAWRDPADAEMESRIARHRADRAGRGWETREPGLRLAQEIASCRDGCVLVDCVTLWLSSVGLSQNWDEAAVLAEVDALCAVVADPPCDLALVSNEVGSGVVPESAMGRSFRDLQGWANQRLAAAAQGVVLTVAGIPLWVKPCAP